MLASSLLATTALLPLAFGASIDVAGRSLDVRQDTQLSCVQFQYGGPFTASGFGGWIDLYANITVWHPDNGTYTFDQTRLAVVDGKVQPCGECRTTQQFGFEVCQAADGTGYNGLHNSATTFYGHLLFSENGVKQCLAARRSAGNLDGIDLVPSTCQYNSGVVKTNGQYWTMDAYDDIFKAQLVQDIQGEGHVYGPSPDGRTLYDMSGSGRPWTYYGFDSEWA